MSRNSEAQTRLTVCLAGPPNVGKSTVFNALTGLRQHTGNWTGKTVGPARGRWSLEGRDYEAVDLPGIYSLRGGTPEERVAADWLREHRPDVLVIVLDASSPERSLALALELLPLGLRTLLCLNLCDEAERLGLRPDCAALSEALSVPVVPTRADRRESFERLRRVIAAACLAPARTQTAPAPCPRSPEGGESESPAPSAAPRSPAALARLVCPGEPRPRRDWDRLLLGKWSAWPVLFALLFGLFWLTVRGANLPSAILEELSGRLGALLAQLLSGLPEALRSLLLDGVWATTAKVVSVMLPPMAIFFPLFSLLEDLGLLPRMAFLLDRPFAACGACGRQGLCMCMGCGCNAVGVTGCRIIPNEKERLAAILTNAMTPCNGRFPTLILLAGLALDDGSGLSSLAAAGALTLCMALSFAVTLLSTALLRRTLLRGEAEGFVLELPPFRRPRLGQLLIRSVLDRTLRVLGRAVTVAAPAGALIWLLGRLDLGGTPLLALLARGLDPAAALLGLSGTLLLAFVLSFPANELFFPLAALIAAAGTGEGGTTLLFGVGAAGLRTALCAAVFTLFHWPCSTTVLTVRKETRSAKWTLLSVLLPTAVGVLLCGAIRLLFLLLS